MRHPRFSPCRVETLPNEQQNMEILDWQTQWQIWLLLGRDQCLRVDGPQSMDEWCALGDIAR